MGDETPDLTFVPVDPRPFSPEEAQLVEFLLDDPIAVPELREQVAAATVVSRCGCGCASVGVEVARTAPEACWQPADTPFDRVDWVPLSGEGTGGRDRRVEITLHVVCGYVGELEIWTGRFGESVLPRPETLRRLRL